MRNCSWLDQTYDLVNKAITGTSGNDSISGWMGNDSIVGLVGNDALSGGLGNDTLNGGAGIDSLDGGIGIDTATYSGNFASYVITVGATTTVSHSGSMVPAV